MKFTGAILFPFLSKVIIGISAFSPALAIVSISITMTLKRSISPALIVKQSLFVCNYLDDKP